MTKPQSRAPRAVVKQEENESAMKWIECKSSLAELWKGLPAVPSTESRRAWALARGVEPRLVHRWFGDKKKARKRKGTVHHSEDGYALPSEETSKEQSSSSASLDIAPPLDNPSSPSYLLMSSPPPQTPIDVESDLPVTVSSGALFSKDQTAHPFSLEVSHSESHPSSPAPVIHPGKVDLAVKTEIVDAASLPDPQASTSGKGRRIILRVAPDTEEGPSKRFRKDPGNSKPTTKAGQGKKRRPKKAPKTEAAEQEDLGLGPQANSAPNLATPMMVLPQGFPAGFCAPPYFTYLNPAMAFDAGMTGAHNLPSHSFGNMMYNPFTGAPLFNNILPQFSAFPNQPGQPMLFDGTGSTNFFGQMDHQVSAPFMPGPSLNVPANASVDQNYFAGNFQGFQPGVPVDGAMNLQDPPEPMMSMTDFLNEPLDAGWTYP
ncbi:unnamed protein product [Rhizoctonia solani]|uniref:Homeobox domain-containing protein n=1 Tax=Rhizoctonia solani TaxID=456999 RepID=A0A8H3H3F7_9AGAM|nr:unnamed protein product [Rhizoctonia solani]